MSKGLFSSGDKGMENYSQKIDSHTKALFTIVERQKKLESSLENLNEKVELIEHNLSSLENKESRDVKSVRESIQEVNSELQNLKDFSSKVKKELNEVSKKEEVQVLKKYIDLWEPMNFVTRDELEKTKNEIIQVIKDTFSNK